MKPKFFKRSLLGVTCIVAGCTALALYNKSHAPIPHSTYQKYPFLKDLNLASKRVHKFVDLNEELPERVKSVIFEIENHEKRPVKIEYTDAVEQQVQNRYYFVGGLEALFLCIHQLRKTPDADVVYVNDGEPMIAHRSALQLHEHPTQYPDYNLFDLFVKALESLHLKRRQNPESWNYSPLHYNFLTSPLLVLKTYAGFFFAKLWWELTAKKGASKDDLAVVEAIRNSISFLKDLDEDIRKTTGKSIVNIKGRLFWSVDKKSLERQKKQWDAMGIKIIPATKEELIAETLLDASNHQMVCMRVPGDGEIHPDVVPITIEYLLKKYPKNFTYRKTNLVQVNMDKKSKKVISVVEEDSDGKQRQVPVNHFFASLGHDNVFTPNSKRLYETIPVSALTTDWRVTIPKSLLEERIKLQNTKLSLEEYIEQDLILPCADMFNLHVKVIDHQFKDDKVILYMRATEGASILSTLTDKMDLVNTAYKLNKYFIGEWELLCAGSCSRRSLVRNVPEMKDGLFRYGQAGLGVSLSGAEYNFTKQK